MSSLRQKPQQDYISKLISLGLLCFRYACPYCCPGCEDPLELTISHGWKIYWDVPSHSSCPLRSTSQKADEEREVNSFVVLLEFTMICDLFLINLKTEFISEWFEPLPWYNMQMHEYNLLISSQDRKVHRRRLPKSPGVCQLDENNVHVHPGCIKWQMGHLQPDCSYNDKAWGPLQSFRRWLSICSHHQGESLRWPIQTLSGAKTNKKKNYITIPIHTQLAAHCRDKIYIHIHALYVWQFQFSHTKCACFALHFLTAPSQQHIVSILL